MAELEITSTSAAYGANALDKEKQKGVIGEQQIGEYELIGIPESASEQAKNAFTYASFGDRGTTASVNSYGALIQITQFLGVGTSGFFTVDQDGIEEPYFVHERAQSLMKKCEVTYGAGWIFYNDDCEQEVLQAYKPRKPWKLQFVQDRWPRLTSLGEGDLTVISENFVSEGTVFQQFTYVTEKNVVPIISRKTPLLLPLESHRIRHLDFTSSNSYFNLEDSAYESHLTSDGHSVVWIHKKSELTEPMERTVREELEYLQTVCFIVAISVNGKIRRMKEAEDYNETYQIELEDQETISAEPGRPLKITQAFRLQLIRIPKDEDWSQSKIGIPGSAFRSIDDEGILDPSYQRITFAQNDDHLDFMIRRNLEHILSVCSIPVPTTPGSDKAMMKNSQPKHIKKDITPIALTCGDISGHRIITSASFFAFKFLLSVLEYLKKQATNHPQPARTDNGEIEACHYREYVFSKELCDRIKATCRAHLEWVTAVERLATYTIRTDEVEKLVPAPEAFGWNYWATGTLVGSPDQDSRQSPASMHFQLLKYADYALTLEGDDDKTNSKQSVDQRMEELNPVKTNLEANVKRWIGELDGRNRRGFSAFSTRVSNVGDPKYRLEDHVWIWRLLRSVEKLGLGHIITTKRRSINVPKSLLSQDYSSTEFRRQVLRRFTTENTISGQRMIAVRRSLSQTRFEFRARDTALFYDREDHFFTDLDPLWKATKESQKFHVENQDARWHDPLRYTLALLMGTTKNLGINSRSATDMVNVAKNVLYRSSSGNGLLPGQLNEDTKEAEMFHSAEMRDYYWHVTFEVPYALLSMKREITPSLSVSSNDGIIGAPNDKQTQTETAEPGTVVTSAPGIPETDEFFLGRKNLKMKRSIPFNSLVDQDSIVELFDEWLYPTPSFLHWPPKNDKSPDLSKSEDHDKKTCEFCRKGEELKLHISEHHDEKTCEFCLRSRGFELYRSRGVVVDIPKSKSNMAHRTQPKRNQNEEIEPLSNTGMHNKLKKLRSAYTAKKRLIWCWNANDGTALLCKLATPVADQLHLSEFFEKHIRREKYFFDDTTAAANLWVTEFHLSSYQLLTKDELGDEGSKSTDLKFLGEKSDKFIRRAATGFQFVGDFFDRYWTCHILEYEPLKDLKGQTISEEKLKERFEELIQLDDISLASGKRVWDQRKVLELLLFGRMLSNITRRYEGLLKAINRHLTNLKRKNSSDPDATDEHPEPQKPQEPPKRKTPSESDAAVDILSISNELFSSSLKYKDYSTFSKQWPAFRYTLQVMEEDLTDTFEKIGFWAAREADRKLERPRWTKNDEGRYRSAITKLAAANDQKLRVLQRYHSNIKSLRVSLTDRLDSTRDNLSFESSENVRFFTYVTVVFLPIGFATALFSMNAVPAGRLVGEMVGAAFITFMVTVVALVNARHFFGLFDKSNDWGKGKITGFSPTDRKQQCLKNQEEQQRLKERRKQCSSPV